jgi:cyanophycinase
LPDSKSTTERGCLFAIGGRVARRGSIEVLGEFVAQCGGADARLVVISTASPDPTHRVAEYDAAFRSLGMRELVFFHQDRRADASDPTLLDAVERADGVFFTGGNQLKLVTTIAGTPLETRLRERHGLGLHLGGTSAGASAMSSVMIARGKSRSAARLSSLRMSPGFAILPGVIIDQHFRERDRFGRLLAAVLCNPAMLGFGLDEDTAFVLDADDVVRVVGNGSLTIVDATQLEDSNLDVVPEDEPAAFSGMRLHVLTSGWCFDLNTHRVERPRCDETEPIDAEEAPPATPRLRASLEAETQDEALGFGCPSQADAERPPASGAGRRTSTDSGGFPRDPFRARRPTRSRTPRSGRPGCDRPRGVRGAAPSESAQPGGAPRRRR